MALIVSQGKISVLLLFDLDPNWSSTEQEEALRITSDLEKALSSLGYTLKLAPVTSTDLDSVLSKHDPLENLVFNWCESLPGARHSEWLVAKYLEKSGFTFSGAGSAALRLAQDKGRLKQRLDKAGIFTPRWQKFNRNSSINWNNFPAIVKPSTEHCSEGIDRNSVCDTERELIERVHYIFEKFRQPAIVEDFIDGRELHVSLWGNGDGVDMLPPAEMEFSLFTDQHDRLCSYEAKFVPESVQYQNIKTVLPASLTESELTDIEQACKSAYSIAGCRDYARIDLRIKDGFCYILDVNPNSDISQDTSTVASAELTGYSYGKFAERIVGLSWARHPSYKRQVYVNHPEQRYANDISSKTNDYTISNR